MATKGVIVKKITIFLLLLTATRLYAAAPSRQNVYTSGEVITASDVTENEDAIYNYLNAGVEVVKDNTIVNADISTGANIQASKLNLTSISQSIANTGTFANTGNVTITGDTDISGGITGTGLVVTTNLQGTHLISCDTIDTDAAGIMSCGTDEGTETNTLETTITGIETTEIFIGDGSNSGTFAALSSDVTMDNAGAVTIAANAVDSDEYVDGSIDAVHLAADIISETKIADDGIDSEHYNDGSIDAVHLAADIIDETKIADDGIDSEHYNDGSVDAVHLATADFTDFSCSAGVCTLDDDVIEPDEIGDADHGDISWLNGIASVEGMSYDSVADIEDIASALKSGSDGTLITGTAGSNGHCLQWNGDGDVITTGASCGVGVTGNDTEVLFFDGANNPAGDAGMTYDSTANKLTISGQLVVGGSGQSVLEEGLVVNDDQTSISSDQDFIVRTTSESLFLLVDASADQFRVGDGATDYIQVTAAGAMTGAGTASIDGEILVADSVDDDSIDFGDVTCVDMTMSDCGAITTTTDITLENGEKIDNGTDGVIVFDGHIVIEQQGDDRDVSGITDDDKILRIYSSDATEATDYIEMYHDQADGVIATGSGDLKLNTAGSIVIPNGTTPTTSTEGSLAWNSTYDSLQVSDGTDSFLVGGLKMFSMTIYDPDTIQAVTDAVVVLPVESEWAPNGITLVDLGIKTYTTTTYSVNFEEWGNLNGVGNSTIETVATSGSYTAADDGTLTDSYVSSDSLIMIDLPTTDIDQLNVWGTFRIRERI